MGFVIFRHQLNHLFPISMYFWSSVELVLSYVLLFLHISRIGTFLCLANFVHQLDWLFLVSCYFCPSFGLVISCILRLLASS